MEYKSYQHIEKLGREECEGILNGTVTIQPKIDGTNSVVWLGDDGNVHAGSRKRELSLDNDNAGFMAQIIDDENIKSYLHKHSNHYVYGEFLVPHTIRTYDSDAWKKFYIFDVFELNDNYGRYLPYDEYVPLLEEFNLKQDEVAERVSKSRTAVTNSMRLLKLDERVQQMIIDDMISTGHARALLAIDDKDEQYNLANRIFDEKLSVRDTEKLVKEIKNPKKPKEKVKTVNDFIYKDLANKMKEIMGTKVSIASKGNGKGKIEIEYYSDEELERMFDMIVSIGKEE